MNQHITSKEKLGIQFSKHSLEELVLIFAMEGTILSIGWDLDSMEQKLFSIHQPQSQVSQNLYGQSKLEMQPSLIITFQLASTG